MSEMVPTGSKYTDEDRTQAAIQYAIKGNMVAVADDTGIARPTLVGWKGTDWWDTIITRVRQEKTDQHIAQYTAIIDKAQAVTLAKLGDATASQAAVVAGIATDKARLLLNLPTSISSTQGTTEAINALAKQFKELSDSYKIKDVVSDQ